MDLLGARDEVENKNYPLDNLMRRLQYYESIKK